MWPVQIDVKPNILIVGYRKFSQLIHTVVPEFEAQARVKIVDYVFDHDVDIETIVTRNKADVVVSAGANAAYLQDTLAVPVISLQVLDVDIIQAILKAKSLSQKVVAITFGHDEPDSVWRQMVSLLGVDVCIKHYLTPAEARETLYLAINEGYEVVIGGSFVCELAERSGVKSLFLYSSRACHQLMQRALKTATDWQQTRLYESLNAALFEVPDNPVIALDNRGRVVRISESAESCLALSDEAIPGFANLLNNEYASLSDGSEAVLAFNGRNWQVSCSNIIVGKQFAIRLFRFRPEQSRFKGGEAARQRAAGGRRNEFIHASTAMDEVQRLIETYAKTQGTVLISGETGTGKELVARQLHYHSHYADGEFVAINCGAIPDELFESELFGYVDGAFTSSRRGGRKGLLESANNGVFFLDEISEMPLSQQAKLLRVMQEKALRPLGSNREVFIDVKFVAASNRDLLDCVKEGRFREDLYYRINVFSISLPNLCSRGADVMAIADYFTRKMSGYYRDSVDVTEFLALLEAYLLAYRWPGNVRELENIMERLLVAFPTFATKEAFIRALPAIVPEWFRSPVASAGGAENVGGSIKDQELRMIREALEQFGGDRAKAAKALGISPTTLWRRLKSHRDG